MKLAARDRRHGTMNAYSNLGCRCDRCRRAQREWYMQNHAIPCYRCGAMIYTHGTKHRAALDERGGLCGRCYAETTRIDVHGTEFLYTRGCRCAACREAQAEA